MKIKRLLAMVLCGLMSLSILPFATAADTVEISTKAEFIAIGNDLDGNYKLVSDIVFDKGESFVPFGEFSGTLDGGGHSVVGLKIKETFDIATNRYEVGLIRNLKGTVKNLRLIGVDISYTVTEGETVNTGNYIGAIAGRSFGGVIENCAVYGSLSAKGSGLNKLDVGGIVGYNSGTVRNSMVRVELRFSRDRVVACRMGGIAGHAESNISTDTDCLIESCFADAKLNYINTADSELAICCGNLVGRLTNGAVVNSCAVGILAGEFAGENWSVDEGSFAIDAVAATMQETFLAFDFDSVWKIPHGKLALQRFDCYGHTWQVIREASYVKAGRKELRCVSCDALLEHKSIDKLKGEDVLDIFSDVSKSQWYYKNGSLNFAYNMGVLKGVDGNKIDPNGNVQRGMFVTILGRLSGVEVSNKIRTVFDDVEKGKYYTGYVKWAADNDIVTGTSDTTFAPAELVTREQICTMVQRYCKYVDVSLDKSVKAITFTDAKKISSWARKAVGACQRGGVVSGIANGDGSYSFDPGGTATRAQVATILMNFYNKYM